MNKWSEQKRTSAQNEANNKNKGSLQNKPNDTSSDLPIVTNLNTT